MQGLLLSPLSPAYELPMQLPQVFGVLPHLCLFKLVQSGAAVQFLLFMVELIVLIACFVFPVLPALDDKMFRIWAACWEEDALDGRTVVIVVSVVFADKVSITVPTQVSAYELLEDPPGSMDVAYVIIDGD
jgi:hypothetical protein